MNDFFDFDQTLRGHIPGERVFDRYKLIKTLGQGGMGVVWLALDEQLEREVALKFLPEPVAHDPAAINDLKRETKKALKLTHPNIVRIYDFLQNDQMVAVSMEHVDGLSLTQIRLEEPNQVFSTEQIEKWIGQICVALDYAHIDEQIAHRDLKPSNLLVNSKGDIKITDFGISATISDATTYTQMNASSSGTPVYMCPQQMMGEKAAPTDDIYSLGATIYELLTGKPPFFSGRIDLQLQNKIPPLMKERRKELDVKAESKIPNSWESTVASCLEKAAEDRPQSLAEVWDGLHGIVTESDNSKPNKKSRGGKKILATACILLLLSGAGAAGWYFGTDIFNKAPDTTPDTPPEQEIPVVVKDTPPAENTEKPDKLPEENKAAQDTNVVEPETKTPELTKEEPTPAKNETPPETISEVESKQDVSDQQVPQKNDISGSAKADPVVEKIEPIQQKQEDLTPQTPTVEETPKEEIIFPEAGPQPGKDWVLPGYGVEMVWIEPGEFMMGERSVHQVHITEGFWLGSYEVTQSQWESVMGFNPSKFRNADGNTPIDQVSWSDAIDFCTILTEIEHDAGRLPKDYEYSLPTEAQWEYACKAGRNSFFSFGDRIDSSLANFNGNYPFGGGRKGDYRQKPLPVGSFTPNGWGLYDMHGNVSEWCYDWYGKYNLRDTKDPTGAKKGSGHVTRGGAWHSDGESCTSGARDYEKTESKNSYLGFRLALRPVQK
jgi:serine/threonine protein kinase